MGGEVGGESEDSVKLQLEKLSFKTDCTEAANLDVSHICCSLPPQTYHPAFLYTAPHPHRSNGQGEG